MTNIGVSGERVLVVDDEADIVAPRSPAVAATSCNGPVTTLLGLNRRAPPDVR
jgi:hypothetical protein